MSRLEISHDGESLTLSQAPQEHLLSAGCSLAFSFVCITAVWLAALIGEMQAPRRQAVPSSSTFPDPAVSLSGLLMLTGFLLLLILVPWFVIKVNRSGLVFTFQRSSGLFLRNGRVITSMRRIESILIRRTKGIDDRFSYRLIIVYHDGHEIPVHDAYNEIEVWRIADEIASFIKIPVVYRGEKGEGLLFPTTETTEENP